MTARKSHHTLFEQSMQAAATDAARRAARELRELREIEERRERRERQEEFRGLPVADRERIKANQRIEAASVELVANSTDDVANVKPGTKVSFFDVTSLCAGRRIVVTGTVKEIWNGAVFRNTYQLRLVEQPARHAAHIFYRKDGAGDASKIYIHKTADDFAPIVEREQQRAREAVAEAEAQQPKRETGDEMAARVERQVEDRAWRRNVDRFAEVVHQDAQDNRAAIATAELKRESVSDGDFFRLLREAVILATPFAPEQEWSDTSGDWYLLAWQDRALGYNAIDDILFQVVSDQDKAEVRGLLEAGHTIRIGPGKPGQGDLGEYEREVKKRARRVMEVYEERGWTTDIDYTVSPPKVREDSPFKDKLQPLLEEGL